MSEPEIEETAVEVAPQPDPEVVDKIREKLKATFGVEPTDPRLMRRFRPRPGSRLRAKDGRFYVLQRDGSIQREGGKDHRSKKERRKARRSAKAVAP